MNHYEETGIASLLPGLELVLQCLGAEVERMLELVQRNESGVSTTDTAVTNGGWSNRKNRRRSTAASRSWRKKTEKQKRAWVAAIQRGKAKAKTEEK